MEPHRSTAFQARAGTLAPGSALARPLGSGTFALAMVVGTHLGAVSAAGHAAPAPLAGLRDVEEEEHAALARAATQSSSRFALDQLGRGIRERAQEVLVRGQRLAHALVAPRGEHGSRGGPVQPQGLVEPVVAG